MSGAFDGLPAQPEARRLLESALAAPGHAYLLAGPRARGKRRYAERFAAALLGIAASARIESRTHPDLFVLEPEGAGDPDRRRAPRCAATCTCARSRRDRRVYLILDAHLLRDDSANALLKSLEEPPAYAVFVLVSDHAERMLATIRSRRGAGAVPAASGRPSWRRVTGDPVAARAALGDLGRAERLAARRRRRRAPPRRTWRWPAPARRSRLRPGRGRGRRGRRRGRRPLGARPGAGRSSSEALLQLDRVDDKRERRR